ncbi:MAG: hypothetical protein HUU54_01850 [Ignavibacteriaceae bacterium]|nr:hypothetical protein [Ignavibacteriaceae bacterium]
MKKLVIIILFFAAYSFAQNVKSFTAFSCASIVTNQTELSLNEKLVNQVNDAFLEAMNKSGSYSLNIGGDKSKNPKNLFEILQLIDSRADSNDLGIYTIIGAWRPMGNAEYSLTNSENLSVTFSYIMNFMRINPAKNQLLILLMPKGYTIPPGAIAQKPSPTSPGVNVMFISQSSQSSFEDLVSDYISAIESIDNGPDSDLNRDRMINVTEMLKQIEKSLTEEKIRFETVHLVSGPELNLREVK